MLNYSVDIDSKSLSFLGGGSFSELVRVQLSQLVKHMGISMLFNRSVIERLIIFAWLK